MNIIEAVKKLKAGEGRCATRKGEDWGVHMYDGDKWPQFGKCRIALEVRDILADDWEVK